MRSLPRSTRPGGRLFGALALLAALPACWTTVRWPEPMGGLEVPGEGVPSRPGGPLEVTVLRLSDPVQIRRPGAASAYPLRFFSKQERVPSGTTVLCGAGGRAEVLWTETGTGVVLHDEGAVVVGEPTRGEPTMRLLGARSARVSLLPTDRVQLPGGAVLTSLGDELAGPVGLERVASDVLRVHNRTKSRLSVAFREATLTLNSGEILDLPPLSSGGVPRPEDPDLVTLPGPSLPVRVGGAYVFAGDRDGLRVRGVDRVEVLGQGVRVLLEPGDEAVLSPLRPAAGVPEVDPPPSEPLEPSSAPPGPDADAVPSP